MLWRVLPKAQIHVNFVSIIYAQHLIGYGIMIDIPTYHQVWYHAFFLLDHPMVALQLMWANDK